MSVKFNRKCLYPINADGIRKLKGTATECHVSRFLGKYGNLEEIEMREVFMLRLVKSAFKALTLRNYICTSGGGLQMAGGMRKFFFFFLLLMIRFQNCSLLKN